MEAKSIKYVSHMWYPVSFSVKRQSVFILYFSALFATCGIPVFFVCLSLLENGGGSCLLFVDTTSPGNIFGPRATDTSIETSLLLGRRARSTSRQPDGYSADSSTTVGSLKNPAS